MTKKVNYYKLGVLVLSSTMISIAFIIWLGAGQLFQKKILLETYFDESVQGLSVGSKVKYRGVNIGEVTDISFTFTKYEENVSPAQRKRYVLVEAALQPDVVNYDVRFATQGDISKEIAKGLRIRLASQGITGVSYLEIDYVDPIHNAPLPITWQPQYRYIPTSPSTAKQFMKSFEQVFDRLQALDIEESITNWNRLLTSAASRVEAVNTAQISKRTNQILHKIDQFPLEQLGKDTGVLIAQLKNVSGGLQTLINDPNTQQTPGDLNIAAKKLREALESPKFNQALHHLERSLRRFDRITASGESDMSMTLEHLQQITANLRDLSETAKRYPATVLFGQEPYPAKEKP